MSFKANVVLAVVVMVVGFAMVAEAGPITALCIRNCGYCKEMYGAYFNGRACAEHCIFSKGVGIPDCNNPVTFDRFLKRFI
ncbi:eclosion hormone-like [Oratosquilla oratoria]|uniref:eclosion hormone-like n=1 Tax=Oratosquilla oratoria TaxID=337810 RepID=UPI003F7728DF